jgi:hypothetical protein
MKDIDQELKHALRRCEPLEGFADRVLARLKEEERPQMALRPKVRLLHWPVLRWAVVAVLISMGIGLVYRAHEQRIEEANALLAKQQVMLALRIAGSKLRVAKQRVRAVESGQTKAEKTL